MRPAFCTQCGAVLGAQTRFCVNCGARVEETAGAAATPPQGSQPPVAAPQATVAFTPPRQPSAWTEPIPPASPAGLAYGPPPVTEKGFSVGQMIKFGWRTTTGNFWTVVGMFTVGIVIYGVAQGVVAAVGSGNDTLGLLLYFIVSVAGGPLLWLGFIRMGLKLADGQSISLGDYFQDPVLALYLLLAGIVYYIIVLVGFILLFFPGVIWSAKFSLFPYFVVDRRMGPIQALKASSRASDGAKWDIVALYVVSTLLIYLGALALIVGMLVALPVVVVAWSLMYRRLLTQTEQMTGPLVV
jgi:uncharacterized membrane protein